MCHSKKGPERSFFVLMEVAMHADGTSSLISVLADVSAEIDSIDLSTISAPEAIEVPTSMNFIVVGELSDNLKRIFGYLQKLNLECLEMSSASTKAHMMSVFDKITDTMLEGEEVSTDDVIASLRGQSEMPAELYFLNLRTDLVQALFEEEVVRQFPELVNFESFDVDSSWQVGYFAKVEVQEASENKKPQVLFCYPDGSMVAGSLADLAKLSPEAARQAEQRLQERPGATVGVVLQGAPAPSNLSGGSEGLLGLLQLLRKAGSVRRS